MANNFQTGQILTATQLNNAFANTVPATGGRMTGDLSLPNIKPDNPVDIAHGGTGANDAVSATKALGFQPTNATARKVHDKLADVISVVDFGAIGDDITDNTAAITNAIANANGKTIYVPKGKYVVTGNLAMPSTAKFEYEAGARITTSGAGKITDNARHFGLFAGRGDEYRGDTKTEGLYLELNSPLTGAGASSSYMLNRILISDDRIDAQNDNVPGSKIDGMIVQHNFGGTGARGGRHAMEAVLSQNAPTELDNTDTNYVGCAAVVVSNTGDGGTSSSPKGEYFAANFYAVANNTQYINHLNGCESNAVVNDPNTKVKYRCGYSAVSGGVVQGFGTDCAYSISALGESGAKWRYGIELGGQNGRLPVQSAYLRLRDTGACGNTFFSCGGDIPQNIVVSDTDTRFKLRVDTLQMWYPNANMILGNNGTPNTPYIDFYAGDSNKAGRLIITSALAGDTNGTFNVQFRQMVTRDVLPQGDNSFMLGTAGQRWSTIYAGTGSINTSDERLKTNWAEIEEAEKRAALNIKSVIKRYQFKDSISDKGGKARYHFGVGAQTVAKIMRDEGLDPTLYAFYCYDEWQATEAMLDGEGNVVQPAQEAGDRYGIRYDELAMFILASI